MRIIGIDPGTGSFDFFGMEDRKVIIDATIPIPDVGQNPGILLDTIDKLMPLDVIIGPSGYGLPVTRIADMEQHELDLMVPDDKSIPLYDGIRSVLKLMKGRKLPVWFTPGVIHLPTVPVWRKANKLDMGTADKVCCTALAVRDQAEFLKIPCNRTSFILAEVGFAFTAVIAVQDGQIIDGLGGTSGGPGFLSSGNMDSELAIRLGNFPGTVLFSGGARDAGGPEVVTPEDIAREPSRYEAAWNMLIESICKSVAAMNAVAAKPREVLISGRLSRIPQICGALEEKLSRYGKVRRVRRRAATAKEAAEGAYIIGEGLMEGQYRGIIEALHLLSARGTMYDYVTLKGINLEKPV